MITSIAENKGKIDRYMELLMDAKDLSVDELLQKVLVRDVSKCSNMIHY